MFLIFTYFKKKKFWSSSGNYVLYFNKYFIDSIGRVKYSVPIFYFNIVPTSLQNVCSYKVGVI